MRDRYWISDFIEKVSPRLKMTFDEGMDWEPSPLIMERLATLRESEKRYDSVDRSHCGGRKSKREQ